MQCHSPSLGPRGTMFIAFEDRERDTLLLESLGDCESYDSCAGYEDMEGWLRNLGAHVFAQTVWNNCYESA